ncbi:MAG: cytochrome D1 domain-containing protein [Acidobacteriaceae bacterium]
MAALATGAAGGQRLLVANQVDRTISVIDPAVGKVVATVAEPVRGQWVHEVAASPDGRTAYAPVYGNSGVGRPGLDGRVLLVIDVGTGRVLRTVDFGHGVRPHLPVLDAAHGLLYVTTELDNAVTVIDTKTLRIVGKVPTGQAESHMLAISHDGRFGYTANVGPGTVSVLDLAARRTLAIIPVASTVQRIAITSDDRYVFTSDQKLPRLAVINTATRKVERWVALPGIGYGGAVTPDGRWFLIALPEKNSVAVVDLRSMTVARTIPVDHAPQAVLVRPDGRTAYVSCAASSVVTAIDLIGWKVDEAIPAGRWDDGMAWAAKRGD